MLQAVPALTQTRDDLRSSYFRANPSVPKSPYIKTAEIRRRVYRQKFSERNNRVDTPAKLANNSACAIEQKEGVPQSRARNKRRKTTVATKSQSKHHAAPDTLDEDNIFMCSDQFILDFEQFIRSNDGSLVIEPHLHRLNKGRLVMRHNDTEEPGWRRTTLDLSRSLTVDGVKASTTLWRVAIAVVCCGLYVPQALTFLRTIGVSSVTKSGNLADERLLRDCIAKVSPLVVQEGEAELGFIRSIWARLTRRLSCITDARYDSGANEKPCFSELCFSNLFDYGAWMARSAGE